MCDEWMSVVTLPLSLEQFHQLPRNPAYKYEYLEGEAYLTPRPRFYHALLDLTQLAEAPTPRGVSLRPMGDADKDDLERIFAAAFDRQPPFSGLESERRKEAARRSLQKTRDGGDGPWLPAASFVAVEDDKQPVGGIFITLLPDEDPAEWDSFHWREPPPPDCVESRLGRPHVTWIFVGPWHAGTGTGTALLATAGATLRQMGYRQLASTFLVGNDSSMLWHWRNGFQLQAHPGSRRRWAQLR